MILRAFAVWLLLLALETVHGVFRRFAIEPWSGDFAARQIGVFTGSVLILIVTYLFVDWIRAETVRQLWLIGFIWVVFTFVFEVTIGRFAFAYSWERVLSDFNLARGGLLGLGLALMGCAPRLTASLRRSRTANPEARIPSG